MKKLTDWLTGGSEPDRLLQAATIVAGLRLMLVGAVLLGFDLETWWWFKGAEVWCGLAFAVLEGKALAYMSRLWVGLRPSSKTEWVYWSVLAGGQLILLASITGVTALAATSVRREVPIDELIGPLGGIAWSVFAIVLNPIMGSLIGIARAVDPKEQQAATDRAPWPPVETQLELFVQQLGDRVVTPDEAARQFFELTKISIATRDFARALASRNLARLSARVDESATGEGVQGEQESKALTIRTEQAQADELPVSVRRARVQELKAQGMNRAAIARKLGVHPSTVKRDEEWLKQEAGRVRGNGKVREKVV